jgi:hypothetical protein
LDWLMGSLTEANALAARFTSADCASLDPLA